MKQVTIIIRALMSEHISQAQLDEIAADAAVQVAEPNGLPSADLVETEALLGFGPYSVQRFRTKQDPNGNPRRVFVFRDGAGNIMQTTDEEYRGRAAIAEFEHLVGTKVVDLGDADCSVTEYKELLRHKN